MAKLRSFKKGLTSLQERAQFFMDYFVPAHAEGDTVEKIALQWARASVKLCTDLQAADAQNISTALQGLEQEYYEPLLKSYVPTQKPLKTYTLTEMMYTFYHTQSSVIKTKTAPKNTYTTLEDKTIWFTPASDTPTDAHFYTPSRKNAVAITNAIGKDGQKVAKGQSFVPSSTQELPAPAIASPSTPPRKRKTSAAATPSDSIFVHSPRSWDQIDTALVTLSLKPSSSAQAPTSLQVPSSEKATKSTDNATSPKRRRAKSEAPTPESVGVDTEAPKSKKSSRNKSEESQEVQTTRSRSKSTTTPTSDKAPKSKKPRKHSGSKPQETVPAPLPDLTESDQNRVDTLIGLGLYNLRHFSPKNGTGTTSSNSQVAKLEKRGHTQESPQATASAQPNDGDNWKAKSKKTSGDSLDLAK